MPESLPRRFSCKGGLRDRNLAGVIYCLVPASSSDSDILVELETPPPEAFSARVGWPLVFQQSLSYVRKNAYLKGGRLMKKQFGILTVVVLLSSLFLVLIPDGAWAATKKEINTNVDVALKRFAADVKGADEFLKASKGTLVMARVEQAGFILGAKYGNGALRVGGKTVGYYNMAAGSAGLQIGVEQFNLILCFMDEAALKKFRASKGWQAGLDGTVALVTMGAGGSVDTTKLKEPIVGFVFGQAGLMAGITLEGLKFTRTHPK